MRQFRTTIDIAASTERVWQVMSDTDRWHEWTPSVTSIKRIGGGPFAIGSRLVIRQPKFPPALWKLTAIEPGRSFTWVSRAPGLFGRLTRGITERYLAFEANGLKARSEDPAFRWEPHERQSHHDVA